MADDIQTPKLDTIFDCVFDPSIAEKLSAFPDQCEIEIFDAAIKNGDIWAVEKKWRVEALLAVKKNAFKGDPQAQFDLAETYYHVKNYNDAKTWYKASAIKGNPEAQWMTGNLYHYGQGVNKDYEEAKKWWSLAAQQEFKPAMQIVKIINQQELK